MDRQRTIFLVFLALLLLVFGCTESEFRDKIKPLTGELQPRDFTLDASEDIMDYADGTCIAMVCKNKTPPFPLNLFFDSSLKGGNCSFFPCTVTEYNKMISGQTPDTSVRLFMFGAGHSFLSFSEANLYCNNSMKMSIKWLIGSNYTPYPVPTKSRAECFLEKNIIPVYVLYSNFTDINATRAGQIARNLSGAGPAILVSEAELDDTNESRYPLIKSQVHEMRLGCEKCLIALGLKLNGTSEYNVTRKLFGDASFLKDIDLVAYGLNSHYFSDCNPDMMIWYGVSYSKYILHNYTKPSLVTYALFDAGNSSDDSCKWFNETAGNGYSELYSYVGTLASNGIIGASLYSLYGIGPLMCEDCAFINPNFGADECNQQFNEVEINPRFFNYMGFCQAYYNGIGENVSGIVPAVFSNGSAECNFAYNTNILRYLNISDVEIKPLIQYEITESKPFFSCAGCFGNGTIPTDFSPAPNPPAPGNTECHAFEPSIEIAADNWDMDPTLLRAAVWQESNFVKCAVSYVPIAWSTCNPHNLNPVADPDGCCLFGTGEKWYEDPNSNNPVTPCKKQSAFAPGAPMGQECKPCAYGLAQVIEYPSEIYKTYSDPLPEAVRVCATQMEGGYPVFNPYRPYDSPCDYAYKFMNINLPTGRRIVAGNLTSLNVGTDENKKEWYSVFFALDLMLGSGHQSKPACHAPSETQQDWINHFAMQKNRADCGTNPVTCEGEALPNPSCCGNPDFLNYIRYCEHNGSSPFPPVSYAYDILEKYYRLGKDCDEKYCPDTDMADRNTMEYLCTHGYVAGAPGVADCCAYAQTPLGYSAWWFCYLNPSTPPACIEKYCKTI